MQLAQRRRKSWEEVKQLPKDEMLEARLETVINGIHVGRGKLRGQDTAEVALVAERRRRVRNLSPEAKEVIRFVKRSLRSKGYDFKTRTERTAGIITHVVKIHPLRPRVAKTNRSQQQNRR